MRQFKIGDRVQIVDKNTGSFQEYTTIGGETHNAWKTAEWHTRYFSKKTGVEMSRGRGPWLGRSDFKIVPISGDQSENEKRALENKERWKINQKISDAVSFATENATTLDQLIAIHDAIVAVLGQATVGEK